MWCILLGAQLARADYYDRQESLVVGASLVFGQGSRVGVGIDVGYQFQRYWERGRLIDGEFTVWGDEVIAPNWGPVAHLWRADGAWFLTAGARAGATWPLRVGVGGGWWPGPGVTGELALLMSTNGKVGVDGQLAVDATWAQVRAGAALGTGGLHTPRVSVGVLVPLVQPVNWPDTNGDVWDPNKTVVPPDGDGPDTMSGYTVTGTTAP